MQDITAVRLVDDRLAWYPPGASDEPRWLDDDSGKEQLRAALAQRRSGVCFAAPGADARLMTLPITRAEKKHIAKSLPFTLEEQVAADIDELHFAHAALGKEQLAVAICSRDKMSQWRELLEEFPGINRWSPEPLLLPWQEGQWCLVIEGDAVIVRNGRCEGCSIERALLPVVLSALLAEGEVPEAVIVYGEDQEEDLALLPEAVRELAQWRKGNLYSALLLSADVDVNLNLLQGDYAARLPLRKWWLQWRSVAVVFAAAFALQLLAVFLDLRQLQAHNLSLRAAIEQSYRTAFPRGQIVEAEVQLQRQLAALRGTPQTSGFVSLVDRVGQAIATMPDTTIATMNYNDKTHEMRLNIIAADFESVERLRVLINEAGLNAVMESSNAQGDKVRARLRVGGSA